MAIIRFTPERRKLFRESGGDSLKPGCWDGAGKDPPYGGGGTGRCWGGRGDAEGDEGVMRGWGDVGGDEGVMRGWGDAGGDGAVLRMPEHTHRSRLYRSGVLSPGEGTACPGAEGEGAAPTGEGGCYPPGETEAAPPPSTPGGS